jgi:hypothetical protein
MVSLTSLLLPTLLSGVALFFASFLSWMVLQLHRQDWNRIPQEEAFLDAVRQLNLPARSYIFPMGESPEQMQSEEFQARLRKGPQGVLTVFPGPVGMGRNLTLTFLFFLVTSFGIAFLARLGLEPGAPFLLVFLFVATAGLLTHLSGIVSHAIWFRCRIVGHVVESIAYGLILGVIFASLWPNH